MKMDKDELMNFAITRTKIKIKIVIIRYKWTLML